MPIKANLTIAGRLNAAQVAISNSLADSEIQSLVAAYGYPASRLNEGQALYDAAFAAVTAQKSAAGAQKQATQELALAEASARDAYQALAKVARAIFQNDKGRLTALGLNGTTPIATAAFLASAASLFENAGAATDLEDYGYTAERLESEREKIAAYNLANQKQEAAKGAAQQATSLQDAALTTLEAWRAQYVKIARVALRGNKQLLEKIGVPARTGARRAASPAPVPTPSS